MKVVAQPSYKVVTQASYTLRYRVSRLRLWGACWQTFVGPTGLWRQVVLLSGLLMSMFVLVTANANTFYWLAILLTFVGMTGVIGLILSLVTLLKIGGTLCIVKLGPEGLSTQVGQVSSDYRWQDVKCVKEREGSIVIEYESGLGVKVPDRVFADAAARLKFLDDVRRWHELANVANTEHA